MSVEQSIRERAGNCCELCKSEEGLIAYALPPNADGTVDDTILVCGKCAAQLNKKEELDAAHWQCLNESMWSEVLPVQIVSWRMLNRLRHESWAADAIDMMFLDDQALAWAKSTGDHEQGSEVELHRDCNGNLLADGDSVVLIKSLDVKGSSVDAKLGTVVRNIRLVHDNTEQIEGKIDGQTIVILTKYLRKG